MLVMSMRVNQGLRSASRASVGLLSSPLSVAAESRAEPLLALALLSRTEGVRQQAWHMRCAAEARGERQARAGGRHAAWTTRPQRNQFDVPVESSDALLSHDNPAQLTTRILRRSTVLRSRLARLLL